jgi:His-Xaa-Ser system protein HxsD
MTFEGDSASAFHSGTDELGVYARVSIDPNIFSDTAIFKTAYWFTDQYYLFLSKQIDTGLLDVEFRLKDGTSIDNLKIACGEFCNNLLDQEIRQKVLKETMVVRDTLVKKAFFEAKAPLPAKIISDESHLPSSMQSYQEDPVRAGRSD